MQIGAQFAVTERAVRALAGSSEMLRWLENAQATFEHKAKSFAQHAPGTCLLSRCGRARLLPAVLPCTALLLRAALLPSVLQPTLLPCTALLLLSGALLPSAPLVLGPPGGAAARQSAIYDHVAGITLARPRRPPAGAQLDVCRGAGAT